jgi:hypothetical protein
LYPEIAIRKSQCSTNSMVCVVFSAVHKMKTPGNPGLGSLSWAFSVRAGMIFLSGMSPFSWVLLHHRKFCYWPLREDLCPVEFTVLIMFRIFGFFIM